MRIDIDYLNLVIEKCLDKNPDFDSSFLENLIHRLADGKILSVKQENAVENIVQGYKLDI